MDDEKQLTFPRAILFDMDGTLTAPLLDFPAIKAEMGIGTRAILEAMAEMSPEQRARAEAILDRHETEAAERSTLNAGCHELLGWLADRDIPTALVTRNSLRSTRIVLDRHQLSIQVLITREDPPFKPHPGPLLMACERVGCDRNSVWMVGDGRYDIEASAAAEIYSVWISHGRERDFSAQPGCQVQDLLELQVLLEQSHERYRMRPGRV